MSNKKIITVVSRLLKEGMHPYNITYFFPNFSVSEISHIAVEIGLPPCPRGRPKEHFKKLSKAEKENVVKMFNADFDIITISQVLKVDINSVCRFLIVDDTPFGVGRCIKCQTPFVYVGDDTRYCSGCNGKLYRKKRGSAVLFEDVRSLSL
ncbi:MAG: hypothetical protein HY265_03700 [Deltaproteobacteria bacterium]|nr:hypothetical protein [Deltaproteobacteria bacterium]